ncbi:MAG: hypothetical protein ACRC63_01970 [Metamycoplasmataceae bacterium]
MFFKKMFLMSSSIVALPVAATALISCSTVNSLDDNLAQQLESLTSKAAKEIYINFWAREAYAELFLKSINPSSDVNSEEFKKNKEIIKEHLLDLKPIPSSVIIDGIPGDEITTEIFDHLFDAYTFYTAWKTSNDVNYFREQKQIWVEEDLSLDDKTIYLDFQPKFAYSSSTTTPTQFKEDFNLLYKIVQTGIQTQLLNMIIAEFYFTASTSDMIQRGTDYNKIIDGNINTLEYWNATSFDINSPTYFLEKYLVTKTPRIRWNFSSEENNKIENWSNRKITSPKDYMELWAGEQVGTTSSPKRIFSKDLLVESEDALLNNNALDFYGYNSSIEISSTSGNGALSTNEDVIRRFGKETSGLFNYQTNQFVSYDTLVKREKIEKLGAAAYLPKISIRSNTEVTRKTSSQILISDLIIGDEDRSFDTDNKYNEGLNTWKLLDITPILSSTQQSIELKMTYSYNYSDPEGFIDYPYNVIITWNQTSSPAGANIVSELPRTLYFNNIDTNTPFGKQQVYGIDPIVDSKVNVSYYIRLLPEFNWSVDSNGVKEDQTINGTKKAIGKFTMKGTPWYKDDNDAKSTLNLRRLAFSLYMNDDEELLKEIKSYLVLNDISIRPGKIKEVNDILNDLGILYLDKKPDYATPRIKNENE